MKRSETWAATLWRITAGGLLLAVVLITLAQVFARYVLNSSIVWSEELNRLLYVWAILVAAAGAEHMRIGLIADRPRLFRPLAVVGAAAGLGALALIAWGGFQLFNRFGLDRYTTLDLSKSWYFAAAIVGAGLWAVALVWRAAKARAGTMDAP